MLQALLEGDGVSCAGQVGGRHRVGEGDDGRPQVAATTTLQITTLSHLNPDNNNLAKRMDRHLTDLLLSNTKITMPPAAVMNLPLHALVWCMEKA